MIKRAWCISRDPLYRWLVREERKKAVKATLIRMMESKKKVKV